MKIYRSVNTIPIIENREAINEESELIKMKIENTKFGRSILTVSKIHVHTSP